MNKFLNPSVDPLALAKSITEENNKTLRDLFKNRINGSFLIKVKSEVINKIGPELFYFYPIKFDNTRIMTGTDETPEYDICRIIIGTHRHHSIFLTEQEIRNNQKSVDYQNRLISEVIEKIRLRQFGSAFFRKKQLLLGDEFLYFPVPYELFVICMRSMVLMARSQEPVFIDYRDVINNALSSLTLMENNFLSNAYPLCRGMIEQYLKILVLKKHPENREDYDRFCYYEIEQSCCSQKYPDEFIKEYNNRILPSSKSKVDFLHYGWLDKIARYDTKASNRYSIYGILDYLMDNAAEDQYDELNRIKTLYKMCHGYTHGSAVHVRYPLLQYFEISTMLYYVLTSIFENIHSESNMDYLPEDKALVDTLKIDFDILREQYQNRSTDNFNLYYRTHKIDI